MYACLELKLTKNLVADTTDPSSMFDTIFIKQRKFSFLQYNIKLLFYIFKVLCGHSYRWQIFLSLTQSTWIIDVWRCIIWNPSKEVHWHSQFSNPSQVRKLDILSTTTSQDRVQGFQSWGFKYFELLLAALHGSLWGRRGGWGGWRPCILSRRFFLLVVF